MMRFGGDLGGLQGPLGLPQDNLSASATLPPSRLAMFRRFFRYPWWHYVLFAIAITLIYQFTGGTRPAF